MSMGKLQALIRILLLQLERFKLGSTNWYTKNIAVGMEGNSETLKFMKENFEESKAFNYAEFGAYHGGTALSVLKDFPNANLYLFDYEYSIQIMRKSLFPYLDRVHFFSNSQKYLDSYNISFAKLLSSQNINFDYIFIDGAHTFAVDALTFFLADVALKPGGFLDFDDYEWSIATSSLKQNRIMKKLYTKSQFDEKHIKFLVENFVKGAKYKEVVKNKIFKKI
jgi:predicted O-methyltransferase YrrM